MSGCILVPAGLCALALAIRGNGAGWYVVAAICFIASAVHFFGMPTGERTIQSSEMTGTNDYWLYELREQYGLYDGRPQWQIRDWCAARISQEARKRGVKVSDSWVQQNASYLANEIMSRL